jgi:stage II sporulation protein D
MEHPMIRRTLLVTAALGASLLGPSAASGATLFTLNGHGWGHGIGMSQYGALGYAQHGWTHQQILEHYFTGTTIGQLPAGTKERVLLISSRPSIHLSFAKAATGTDQDGTSRSLPAGSYRVDPGAVAGQLRLWSTARGKYVWKGIVSQLTVAPHGGPLKLDDAVNGYIHDHWWGDFRIARSGGSLSLVDVVGMERYVSGVVPCEVPASWLPAAVQSQAVAARSYAAATAGGGSFDAYADTRSQMYCPVERQVAASDAAVAATKHQVVKYGGRVATTFFSSSSGGRTSSISASWGGTNQPYLVPVRDRYDGAGGLNPNHTWARRVFSPSGLGSALGVGSVSSLDATIDGPSQRVLSVLVHGSGGDHSLTAGDVFSRLGLRSTYFRILQVTLAAPKSSTAGDAYHLKGRLWPRPNGAFRLESKKGASGGWQRVMAPVTLDSTGRFSILRRPVADVSYRLVRKGASSPTLRVRVHAALTLAKKGGFHGTMLPRLAGATVSLQRLAGGRWAGVSTATVGAKGGYRFPTAVSQGSWRAHFRRDSDHSSGASATLVIPSARYASFRGAHRDR